MPASVQQPCKHPPIDEVDARLILARYVAAVRTCDAKRADAATFYGDLREGMR